MLKFLTAAAGAAILGACCLTPDAAPVPEAALAAPAAAEPQIPPSLERGSTGKGLFIYHNVSGDCAFLEHTHGRNGAWGFWRLPLGAVSPTGPDAADGEGFTVTFTCTDGSACIEKGAFRTTPDRASSHTIPFETGDGAARYLSQVAGLDKACTALK